jgi:hypothetical protein
MQKLKHGTVRMREQTQYSPLCLALHLNVCFKIDLPAREIELYTAKRFQLKLSVKLHDILMKC